MPTFITDPWPWYVAGPAIALVMFLLLFFGKSFGISDNLRTMCTIMGAERYSHFFKLNWKNKIWNLVFTVGAVIGGFISVRFLSNNQEVALNSKTVSRLESMGFEAVGQSYAPSELFSSEIATSFSGILFLLFGGVLVGFGTRYAGGCTSGHAISGISNLQTSSLIAVVGFFLGGLIMVHLIFPSLLPFWNNI